MSTLPDTVVTTARATVVPAAGGSPPASSLDSRTYVFGQASFVGVLTQPQSSLEDILEPLRILLELISPESFDFASPSMKETLEALITNLVPRLAGWWQHFDRNRPEGWEHTQVALTHCGKNLAHLHARLQETQDSDLMAVCGPIVSSLRANVKALLKLNDQFALTETTHRRGLAIQ